MNADLRVDGSATVYRLHDIGYAVDARSSRGPTRREAPAAVFAQPTRGAGDSDPESAALRRARIVRRRRWGRARPATLSAHLFDFGVCSMHLRVAAAPGISLAGLAEFAGALDASPDPSVDLRPRASQSPRAHGRVGRTTRAWRRCRRNTRCSGSSASRRQRRDGCRRRRRDASPRNELVALLVGERRRLSRPRSARSCRTASRTTTTISRC